LFALLALLGLALVASVIARSRAAQAPPPAALAVSPEPRPQARGQVRPVSQARIGTIAGGVVASLAVDVGETVVEQEEIARVRGTAGIEVLAAPIRGTVTGIPVHVGDTVLPGAGIATVADLSRLQVETTDVDEFLIARVRPGQRVTLIIDALERRLGGQVRTVGLEPAAAVAGSDNNYPVTIDLLDSLPELRAGMTARILFPD